MRVPRGGRLPAPMFGGYRCCNPSVFASLLVPPCYVSNGQIHEDLGVSLFANHIRALTESFDSKLADVGNPLVRQLGKYADRGLSLSLDAKAKGGSGQQASRGHRPRRPSWLNESRSAQISRALFVYPDRFSVIFLSCKANASVFDAKSGHGPHSPPPGSAVSPKCLTNVA